MKRSFFVILFCSAILFSCDNTYHQTIPYKKVDFTIYPNDVIYYKLNTCGGYEYFTGGVSGVVVFRVDEWNFVAYDRSCSFDWELDDSWILMDQSGIMLVDPLCGSLYNILDGSVISGPAKWPLRMYKTRYDGVRLRVYS